MAILGIEFVPWNKPLDQRLQALAAGAWFATVTFLGFFGLLFTLYLLFTRLWWLSLLYLIWIYLDRHTCETGGRPSNWIQNWTWWSYLKKYFPSKLSLDSNFNLDPKRNYLFCCFPHGVIPTGPFTAMAIPASDFHQLYPNFIVKTTALNILYHFPFTREIGNGVGGISCSAKSLNYILSKPEGGYIVILHVGGAEEAMYTLPGRYKFVVNKRKGFVKIALENGAPLVPVITFGETDLFGQIQNPFIMKIQTIFRKCFGFTPIFIIGRGLFQYSFGFIARKKPLTTVVGAPIEVAKVKNPSRQQIEDLHQTFVEQLVELFENHKQKYLEDADKVQLELV